MTQQDKELLLVDLCGRLPYKIVVKVNDTQGIMDEIDIPNERIFVSSLNPFLYGGAKASWFTVNGDKIYPYLRPMSSMTEEEISDLQKINCQFSFNKFDNYAYVGAADDGFCSVREMDNILDYLNSKHFDYRGLIEKGLAIEAPEGMYKPVM